MSPPLRSWWQQGAIYQVYPRSFQDSSGDGVGDLAGIASRLDYIASLGVDAIWLSPIFPSPMADFGYDVADYSNIDPLFGDLAAFDKLLATAHERKLRVLLDFVPNHTSSAHPWFVESRSSRRNPKRDWYIWRDPKPDGAPPNNWISDFGGSSWEWDQHTRQFYLHAFLKEQPDLNWRHPKLREAMFDVLRFWFDRGVDGFRIDVLWHMIKAEGLPDNPPNPDYGPHLGERDKLLQTNSTDQPEVHEISAEFRAIADSYDERLLAGEIFLPNDRLCAYYGTSEKPEIHLPFNFALLENPWDAEHLSRIIAEYDASIPPNGWPSWVIGSHDAPRIAARLGELQARVAAMLLLTLRGTPTLYQGDELGIGPVDIPPDRVRDPRELREPGLGLGRDRSRTPMPWDSSPHAGFSACEPWLPLNGDWRRRNVASQEADPGSMLNHYRGLLQLRREYPALSAGSFASLQGGKDLILFERRFENERLLIALNLGHLPRGIAVPGGTKATQTLLSTLEIQPFLGILRGNEGLILKLEQAH